MNLKTLVFSSTCKMIGNHYSFPYNEKTKPDKLKISDFLGHTRELRLQDKNWRVRCIQRDKAPEIDLPGAGTASQGSFMSMH